MILCFHHSIRIRNNLWWLRYTLFETDCNYFSFSDQKAHLIYSTVGSSLWCFGFLLLRNNVEMQAVCILLTSIYGWVLTYNLSCFAFFHFSTAFCYLQKRWKKVLWISVSMNSLTDAHECSWEVGIVLDWFGH